MPKISVCFAVAAVAVGCTSPVASDLGEGDANRVVVALESSGVLGEKIRDPDVEGRWRVTVPREDAAHAIRVLAEESLPPPHTPGVLEALGPGSIVPSREGEHAKKIAGLAGDLERSLREVSGVLTARVHLAVPESDPLAGEPVPATASVLVAHRGATSPIPIEDVRRLVAGAVPGLSETRVAVVTSAVPAPVRNDDRGLARFGPITLSRSSAGPFRLGLGLVVLLNVALAGVLVVFGSRLRRLRQELDDARSSNDESRGR